MDELKFDSDEDLYSGDEAGRAAFENFGIKYMFPWQRMVVSNILEAYEYFKKTQKLTLEERIVLEEENDDSFCKGKQIVLLPTGAGKSLCFQVPALLLDGPTMVIYPLLALMTDQQRRMEEGSLKSVIFRGGQTKEERNENFDKLKNGAKIILANPEVLESEDLLNELAKVNISHIAIDEGHIVSEWGMTFRKSYLQLGKVIQRINPPVVTAFTATASPEVLKNVSEILFAGEAHVVRSESDRKNIHYFVRYAAAKKKEALKLVQTELHPLIIFCGTRNKAEDMALEINTCFGPGTAKFYHAGLNKTEKENIEQWFYNSKDGVLCSTCAYGMGVDKKDIKTVVHLETSTTAEAYLQESGRGGRNGDIAKGILIWSPKDSMEFSKYPSSSREAAMKNFAETKECRRQVLLDSLAGEQAVCSGCDICNEKKQTLAEYERYMQLGKTQKLIYKVQKQVMRQKYNSDVDWKVAVKLVEKYKYYFTVEELEEELLRKMNGESLKVFGKKVWTHSDVVEIVTQLQENQFLLTDKFLWKGKLYVNKEKNINL